MGDGMREGVFCSTVIDQMRAAIASPTEHKLFPTRASVRLAKFLLKGSEQKIDPANVKASVLKLLADAITPQVNQHIGHKKDKTKARLDDVIAAVPLRPLRELEPVSATKAEAG